MNSGVADFSFPYENEGGPAFPFSSGGLTCYGMSFRDYLAAQVAPTLVARHRADVPWSEIGPLAYQIADALLAARKES